MGYTGNGVGMKHKKKLNLQCYIGLAEMNIAVPHVCNGHIMFVMGTLYTMCIQTNNMRHIVNSVKLKNDTQFAMMVRILHEYCCTPHVHTKRTTQHIINSVKLKEKC